MSKRYFLLSVFFLCVCNLQSQNIIADKDSLTKRFISLIESYDETAVFIDTSAYSNNYPEALDINMRYAAAKGFCREIVRLYVKGADVNSINADQATPLHLASDAGHLCAAEVLLLLGAKRQEKDFYGRTPLMLAAETDNVDIADLLIRYGASPDADNFDGITPLHRAVMNNSFYMADMLIYHQADVNKTDREGNTPLSLAVWNGNFEIADILLGAGADPDIADKKGFTPFMIAAQMGDTTMISLLLKANPDIYRINSYGYDALCLAIKYGHADAVNYLLETGNLWFEKKPDRADLRLLTDKYGTSKMNIPHKLPGSNRGSFGSSLQPSLFAGGSVTNHMAFFTGGAALRSQSLKGGLFAAYSFNPLGSKVLVSQPDVYYQYRIKVSTFEAGLFKEIVSLKSFKHGNITPYISLSGTYRMYSEYRGTDIKPVDSFCLVPSAGTRLDFKWWSVGTEVSYMKTPFYKMYPLWLDLRLSFNLLSDQSTAPGKRVNIYNRYE